MTGTCPDCGLPMATERKTRGAHVDQVLCAARFSPYYEIQCKRVAVALLRARVAELELALNGQTVVLDAAREGVWIPVAERLPDSDTRVLAVNHEADYVVAQLELTDDSEGHGEPCWAAEGGDLALCNYPHWQPLPAPPTTEPKETT